MLDLETYILCGDRKEQFVCVFKRGGSNGKTTFMTPIRTTLGLGYCVDAEIKLLITKGDSAEEPSSKLLACRRALAAFFLESKSEHSVKLRSG